MTTITAAMAVREDLDWVGLAVVLGIGALCIGFAIWEDDTYRPRLQDLVDEALDPVTGPRIYTAPEPDHVECANPDCDQTICACRKPSECTGCITLGCSHGEGLCWDCRPACRECASEARAEADNRWMAGR